MASHRAALVLRALMCARTDTGRSPTSLLLKMGAADPIAAALTRHSKELDVLCQQQRASELSFDAWMQSNHSQYDLHQLHLRVLAVLCAVLRQAAADSDHKRGLGQRLLNAHLRALLKVRGAFIRGREYLLSKRFVRTPIRRKVQVLHITLGLRCMKACRLSF